MMSAKDAKCRLVGHWAGLFSSLAPQISPAITNTGKHTACPVHGGKDGFRVFKNFPETGGGICNTCGEFSDGIALLQWANDWSFKETLRAINQFLNGSIQSTRNHSMKPIATINSKPNAKSQKNINKVLGQATSIKGVTACYLNNRGLGKLALNAINDLKEVESLPYWQDGRILGAYPSMIGLIRNLAGDVVSLHRTYLNPQGHKANVPSTKKLMSPALSGAASGCTIQLFKPTSQLAIAEGIETALAVHLSTNLPVWAAISATMLEKVQIPASVQEVFIMADKDVSGAGERSANKLAQRLLKEDGNITVKICLPPLAIPEGKKSIDWLDIYNIKNAERAA
tara:strand:+ start:3048 stop:4070 length:1023 start_codon:yes stop_codon:yes gene_type:complete